MGLRSLPQKPMLLNPKFNIRIWDIAKNTPYKFTNLPLLETLNLEQNSWIKINDEEVDKVEHLIPTKWAIDSRVFMSMWPIYYFSHGRCSTYLDASIFTSRKKITAQMC